MKAASANPNDLDSFIPDQDYHFHNQENRLLYHPNGHVFIHPDCPPIQFENFFPPPPDFFDMSPDFREPSNNYECCVPAADSQYFECFTYVNPFSNQRIDELYHDRIISERMQNEHFFSSEEFQIFENQDNNLEKGKTAKSPDEKMILNEPKSWECDCENDAQKLFLVPDLILSSRLKSSQRRYKTFKRALELMLQYNAKILVETGTARFGNNLACEHDGCSTLFFGHYAFLTQSKLFSVDISQESCLESMKSTEQFRPYVEVVLSDSLKFLQEFNFGLVDFLYLDSFDWSEQDSVISQKHHLEEIKRIYRSLHKRTIILIDDCSLPYGGKCALVHEFLIEQGWKMVMQDYQNLYLYPSNS